MKKLESLKNAKFDPLNGGSMALVKGGEDTPGGSKVVWEGEIQVPCDGQSGGVEYTRVYMYKVHVWSSDSISETGETCIWGEGYGWLDHK